MKEDSSDRSTSASAPFREEISYPRLPETINFRVKKVLDDQKILEDEILRRKSIYNKYGRVSTVASVLEYVFVAVDILLGTLATVKNDLVNIADHPTSIVVFAVIAMFSGLVKMAQGVLNQKKLKHHKAMVIASTTLCNLDYKISKAIADEQISHQEFEEIQIIMKDWKNGAVHRDQVSPASETMDLLAARMKSDMINQLKNINIQK